MCAIGNCTCGKAGLPRVCVCVSVEVEERERKKRGLIKLRERPGARLCEYRGESTSLSLSLSLFFIRFGETSSPNDSFECSIVIDMKKGGKEKERINNAKSIFLRRVIYRDDADAIERNGAGKRNADAAFCAATGRIGVFRRHWRGDIA